MFEQFYSTTEGAIGRVINFAQGAAWSVVLISLVAAGATAHYTATHISINTDTEAMLSESLPWRVARITYKHDFPYFSDTIVVVIDGATADVASDAAIQLAIALRQEQSLIDNVYYPAGDEFFRRNQMLYLDDTELSTLVDKLSAAQPFLARLAQDQSSAALFGLLTEAVDAGSSDNQIALAPAINRIAAAIEELNLGNEIPLSWQALITDSNMPASTGTLSHREIILVRPKLDFSALLPAEPAILAIEQLSETLNLNALHGIDVRLTGDAALSFDELRSVISESQNAGSTALVMVLVCLIIGLRSFSLVVATLATLIIGLIFTTGFAVACVGTLNMISIAFAVLYVGLGVDFAIHICLRYREMLDQYPADRAVNSASRHIGTSLILCAITTAIGFFAFIPTAYRGVAELGLIAGVGMFISLAVSIFLLPALLHVLPPPKPPRQAALLPNIIASFPRRHSRGVLAVAAILWIVAAICIPAARFDTDPINLNNPAAESVLAYRDLIRDDEQSPLAITTTAGTQESALKQVEALRDLPEVRSVRSITSFIPANQSANLGVIDELSLILGLDLELTPTLPLDPAATFTAIELLLTNLTASVDYNDEALAAATAALEDSLTRFRDSTKVLVPDQKTRKLEALDSKLFTSFAGRVERLQDGLSPEEITLEDLPVHISQRWLSANGTYRIEAYPDADLTRKGEMKRFVSAVRAIAGDSATGTPVINLGASDAVILAFLQAFTYAFIIISALLFFILRSFKETLIVLAPLMLAGLLTAAASVIFELPFNFANIIALPLLLGIGVDSALHILHRYKTALPANGNLLQTSTARAVFFSALTTIVSFGNLATSAHAGTASMGIMLTIGVASTLSCTLLVLPAMLKQFIAINRS